MPSLQLYNQGSLAVFVCFLSVNGDSLLSAQAKENWCLSFFYTPHFINYNWYWPCLWNIPRIQAFLTSPTATTLVQTFTPHMYYYISLLNSLPSFALVQLQPENVARKIILKICSDSWIINQQSSKKLRSDPIYLFNK